MRLKHYAYRTELTYSGWIKRLILFHDKNHPREMGALELEAFLTWLAVDKKISKSTQNQAFNALVFLYRDNLNPIYFVRPGYMKFNVSQLRQ
ncbi:MAG: phage integrase N-terminal SAM-like domain-containing protein [Deltaproteobacteria bacterium]|nr:phage integrase N-terminal SAM-like domain-containing protein [Deltaproteobacteria bacterium]MBW2046587.1 phage integrase N-terminal SAM-like domain-containing protein [Deltaproteobacteria bacterium]MBW2301065.1 phage integrase N-terminal SAM-like domain-containing protein [Deltaproteobacteria bacterium]